MIKNTLPDKSGGNPKSVKKLSKQFKSFSTDVPIVGEDLHPTGCFIYSFMIQMIIEKTLYNKVLLAT